MSRLATRIDALEQRTGTDDQRQAQIREDAEVVMRRLATLAARFADDWRRAQSIDQAGWSPAQRVAWAIRHRPGTAAGTVREHVA